MGSIDDKREGGEDQAKVLAHINNIEYIDRGICCPKTKIDKTIPRTNECKNGTFYIKKYTDKSNFNIDDILIKIT